MKTWAGNRNIQEREREDGPAGPWRSKQMHVNNEGVQDRCPLCRSGDVVREGELSYCGAVEFSTNKIELGHHPELWKCKN